MPRLSLTLAALAAIPLTAAEPVADPTFKEAVTGGTVSVALRARAEIVDTENLNDSAQANTLRLALGYTTQAWQGFSASAQFEGIYDLGGSEYNHPLDPDATRPTILDFATSNELQQAWLRFAPEYSHGLSAKVGRQEIAFDNQRWVGTVGWRQDWQSFDAGRVDFTPKSGALATVSASYAYLAKVRRIFPDEAPQGVADTAAHVVNIAWKACPYLTVIGYGYLLDFESGAIGSGLSTTTVGVRATGAYAFSDPWKVLYTAEFAQQNDYADNPNDVDQAYYLVEAGIGWKSLGLSVGYEVLGGDSTETGNVVNTPLATAHAHNGWADIFAAATPAGGLTDFYIKVGGAIPQVKGMTALAFYHVFSADDGAFAQQDYGTEVDLLVEYRCVTFDPSLLVGVKYASYSADDVSVDTEKIWLYTQYAF